MQELKKIVDREPNSDWQLYISLYFLNFQFNNIKKEDIVQILFYLAFQRKNHKRSQNYIF